MLMSFEEVYEMLKLEELKRQNGLTAEGRTINRDRLLIKHKETGECCGYKY